MQDWCIGGRPPPTSGITAHYTVRHTNLDTTQCRPSPPPPPSAPSSLARRSPSPPRRCARAPRSALREKMFRGTRDAGVVRTPTVRQTASLTPPTPILPTRTQAVAVKRDVRVKADWSIGSPENTVSADAATPRARRDENRIRFKRTPRHPRRADSVPDRARERVAPRALLTRAPSPPFIRSCASTPPRSSSPAASASPPPSTRTTVVPVRLNQPIARTTRRGIIVRRRHAWAGAEGGRGEPVPPRPRSDSPDAYPPSSSDRPRD